MSRIQAANPFSMHAAMPVQRSAAPRPLLAPVARPNAEVRQLMARASGKSGGPSQGFDPQVMQRALAGARPANMADRAGTAKFMFKCVLKGIAEAAGSL